MAEAPADPNPERRLQIGYISADFGQHPVRILPDRRDPRHDRALFEVHCYSSRRHTDDMTARFRQYADHWHDVASVDGRPLAERIRRDGIDILVDLSGHTANNRLQAFTHRPAPVQATWAGYVGTTGIPAIDYLISDPRQTPEGVDAHYVERIVRLPDCYVCYEPPAYAPPVGPLPALRTGIVTYGCFNNLAKIDEASIALWSTLLRDRGDRRLLLRTFALDVPRVKDRIIASFEAHGVRPDQLTLSPACPHPRSAGQLQRGGHRPRPAGLFGRADHPGSALDGRAGDHPAGRPLLHPAQSGASDGRRPYRPRGGRHIGISGRRKDWPPIWRGCPACGRSCGSAWPRSPLCDPQGFTRALEAAYRRMWRDRCVASSSVS